MWCVCAQSYMVQSKKIFDHFICFWKWFLSPFVFMFSVYFVFHCLNMFCIEKHVSEFFAAQLATRQSRNPSRELIQKLLATHSRLACGSLATRESFRDWNSRLARDSLATCSRLAKIFATEPRNSPSRETPRNSFLKGFLWETCFKPLPSSL